MAPTAASTGREVATAVLGPLLVLVLFLLLSPPLLPLLPSLTVEVVDCEAPAVSELVGVPVGLVEAVGVSVAEGVGVVLPVSDRLGVAEGLAPRLREAVAEVDKVELLL